MNDGPTTGPVSDTPEDILTTIFEPVPPPTEGSYGFTSDWEALRTALAKFGPKPGRPVAPGERRKPAKFRLTPSKEQKAPEPIPIRIVVYPDRVKFGAKLGTTFVESILPIVGAVEGFSTRSEPISFVFDLNVLLRVASVLSNRGYVTDKRGVVRGTLGIPFVYEPVQPDGKPALWIRHLNLGTLPQCDVEPFVRSLGAMKPVAVFDPQILHKGLYYARLFAKWTCTDKRLTVIEARDGRLLGADLTGICIFEAPSLANVAISVSLKSLGVFRRVLANLYPATVRLFDSKTHHIIRDHLTCLAWPKTDGKFPLVEKSLQQYHFDDRVTVSRSRLRAELKSMKVLRQTAFFKFAMGQDDDKDFLPAEHDGMAVQLRVTGEGLAAKLALHIRNSEGIGKGGAYNVPCERVTSASDRDKAPSSIDVMVDLASFLLVIEHFGNSEVCFSIAYNDAWVASYLRIEDQDEDGAWHAQTFLELIRHVGRSLPPPRAVKRGRRGTGRGA